MSAAAALDRLLARAHETGVLRADLRSAQVRPLLDVHRANVRAKAACRPRPGGGRLTFFHPRAYSEPTNGWPALAGEPIEVHEMAADHCSMLVLPAVAGSADRLRSWFERSLDAAPGRRLKKAVRPVASAAGPDARRRDAGDAGTSSRSGNAADGPATPQTAGRSAACRIFQQPANAADGSPAAFAPQAAETRS